MQTSGIYGEMFNRPLPVGIAGARLQGNQVLAGADKWVFCQEISGPDPGLLRGNTKFAGILARPGSSQKRQGCHPENVGNIEWRTASAF